MNESSQHNSHNFNLIGFDHVTLVVSDVVSSRGFYVDQLGFQEVQRPEFDFAGAWFQIGQTMVHVTASNELSGDAGWGDRKVERISRGHHVAYRTSDFDQALQAIKDLGIEIASGPKVRPDGVRQVYIYDPDQHLIEICT